MNISEFLTNFQEVFQDFLFNHLAWFIFWTILALIGARILPALLNWSINKIFPNSITDEYNRIISPLQKNIVRTTLIIFIAININVFRPYPALFNFLQFFTYLAVTINVAWLLCQVVRQVSKLYGTKLIKSLSRQGDDLLLILETLTNVVIIFFAIIFFAQSQNLNLASLLTGVGIGGLAIAFAAQEVLSQIVGTVILYLDRPYVPGEYVRANFNPAAEDIYGRVESIGIRSSKIRLAATNTLLIVPNSLMARTDVENISRGNKVMGLLFLNFNKVLAQSERALVDKVLNESLGDLFGVEPGSIRIAMFEPENQFGTRARLSFFLLSSSSSALNIRKQLVAIANQEITQRLGENQLEFSMEEPMLYVNSPVTK
ncbi:mechanosensitive ion channel [Euhalothece natronophila Z-M001]|uniref:Mechanosensitive ion channel n=1 Tax=Euhalothece natronophila Z-M001 TaxID=522448 RepID=A0A5B8NPT3_9CHRO|nr:mechanosensitive ion channel domain-containing protein [Euhalothece natronophila]QDZ41343.1 mechanosensitive ion channel [Euhalothece natronophila Z-M001]